MLKSLYKTYEIDYESLKNDTKNRIRTQTNRTFKKHFENRKWESLTTNEQNYFVLHCMKGYMMKEIEEVIYPFTPSKIKDIKNSVETLIKEQYVLANEHIRKVNKDTEKIHARDENGYSKYGDLQDDLIEIYKSNETINKFSSDIRLSIFETKIDVLLKIVQEKLNVQIQVGAIEECCRYLVENDFTIDEPIQLEIDNQSAIPSKEQKRMIKNNQKYFAYRLQKEQLSFYSDK